MLVVLALLAITLVLDLISLVTQAATNIKISDMDRRLAILEKEWTGR